MIGEFTPVNIKNFLDEWDSCIGVENIVALHTNDSKTPAGSHNDRHENIGEGYIGLKGFQNLAAEPRLHDKAWLLKSQASTTKGLTKRIWRY